MDDNQLGTVQLLGLSFWGFHGVYAAEKTQGNSFTLDVTYCYNIQPAAKSDDISQTVDYTAVYDWIAKRFTNPVNLLETLAVTLCEGLLAEFSAIMWVKLTVTKHNPPIGGACLATAVSYTCARA